MTVKIPVDYGPVSLGLRPKLSEAGKFFNVQVAVAARFGIRRSDRGGFRATFQQARA